MTESRPSVQAGGTIIGCVVASGMIGFATAAFTSGPAATIGGAAVIGAVGLISAALHGWSCTRPDTKRQYDQPPITNYWICHRRFAGRGSCAVQEANSCFLKSNESGSEVGPPCESASRVCWTCQATGPCVSDAFASTVHRRRFVG